MFSCDFSFVLFPCVPFRFVVIRPCVAVPVDVHSRVPFRIDVFRPNTPKVSGDDVPVGVLPCVPFVVVVFRP